MSVAVVQLIQMITAVDVDEPQGGQHFSYSLAPEVANNPNFTLRDNQGTEKTRKAHENVCKDSKYDHFTHQPLGSLVAYCCPLRPGWVIAPQVYIDDY